MIVDTSALLAALFGDQRRHAECAAVLVASDRRILSPFVLAELDYLIGRNAGTAAQLALLHEVERGAYELVAMDSADVAAAAKIVERYADLGIGVTDASLLVLAERHRTVDIFTLDERHFRAMRAPNGQALRLLPADA